MKHRDHSRFRLWLGSLCQVAAWFLCDPHDDWSVVYRCDGHNYCRVVHGPYHMARAVARELGGKIDGCRVQEIPA